MPITNDSAFQSNFLGRFRNDTEYTRFSRLASHFPLDVQTGLSVLEGSPFSKPSSLPEGRDYFFLHGTFQVLQLPPGRIFVEAHQLGGFCPTKHNMPAGGARHGPFTCQTTAYASYANATVTHTSTSVPITCHWIFPA